MVPLGFGGHRYVDARAEGYVPSPDENVAAERVAVGSDYFGTMGIPIVSGRAISSADRPGDAPVAVVNEAFARRFWPGREALGRHVDLGRGWATVIGVARDGKYRDLTERPTPLVYVPLTQWLQPAFTLHLRATGSPRALVEPVRRSLAAAHMDLPALQPRTLAEHMAASTFVQRAGAGIMTALGALALLLSTLGLYGLVAYVVTLRTREIAVRIALGATRGSVVWIVARPMLALAGTGVLVGSALSVAAGRALRSQLVNVGATDPLAFVAATTVLGLAALVATWLPTRRALRVDPATTLRGVEP